MTSDCIQMNRYILDDNKRTQAHTLVICSYYNKQVATCQSFGCVLELFKVLQFHSAKGENFILDVLYISGNPEGMTKKNTCKPSTLQQNSLGLGMH